MIPKTDEVLLYLKEALAYVDGEFEKLEKLASQYFPIYMEWLTRTLSGQNSFVVLSGAVAAIFIVVVYVWFRNR